MSATLAGTAARLREALGALLAAAQRSGSIRGDIGLAELMAILSGILFALRGRSADQPDPHRAVAVLRDGLRTQAAGQRLPPALPDPDRRYAPVSRARAMLACVTRP